MNVFAIASQAWAVDADAVRFTIGMICDSRSNAMVKLDAPGIARVASHVTPSGERPTMVVPLEAWLHAGGSHYRPHESVISRELSQLDSRTILVVDVSQFNNDTVMSVLGHMRRAMFASNNWPAAIAFVTREEFLDESISLVAETFYIIPKRKSLREASNFSYRLHKAATYARWMSWTPAAARRAFAFRSRFESRLRRWLKQDESQLI